MKKQMEKNRKKQKKKKNKRRDHEAKTEHTKTEWVLCSEDWRDIVIMYIPELNDVTTEDNYAEISEEEIKDAYLKYGKQRKPHKKKVK